MFFRTISAPRAFWPCVIALGTAVLIAVAVWFIGPLLAFDDWQPLAGVGIRLTLVALLAALVMLWWFRLPLWPIASVAFCLLIWHAGPMLALGQFRPLVPQSTRIVTIVIVVVVSFALMFYGLWKRLVADKAFARKILKLDDDVESADAASTHNAVALLTNLMQTALRQLKGMRKTGGIRRLVEGKGYLYRLPWYLLIGPAHAGKTAALLNAGLEFPIAEQMAGIAKAQVATENVQWWMTNEAVLIDTAGRYTDQEQNAQADRAEWKTLLGLLRKARPRTPVNGAMLFISCPDLLTKSPDALRVLAASLRARLIELRQDLGVQFPIYVVVTKIDQIAGFAEYFQTLSSEGRAQPWGFTLPLKEGRGQRAAQAASLIDQCRAELDVLINRLRDGLNLRQYEVFDKTACSHMQGMREDMQSLTVPLLNVLEHVFLDSRYDNTEHRPMLRGVYFTSALQTGETVIGNPHTVMRALERSRGAHMTSAADEPGGRNLVRVEKTHASGYRSFFLQEVIQRIIVPEAYLVRPNLRWAFRFRLFRVLCHTVCLALFVWMMFGLRESHQNNGQYLNQVTAKAQEVSQRVVAFYKQSQTAAVPELLDGANDIAAYPGLDPASPALAWRYGLYTAPRILSATTKTHAALQDNLLVPYLVHRVEAALTAAIAAQDSRATYETLRIYLMLHEAEKFNAAEVREWVQADWSTGNAADDFGGRIAALEHLNRLLDGSRVVQSPYARNETLVQSARDFLDDSTSVERLYEQAKTAMAQDAPQDFTLLRAVGPQAGTVFTRAGGEPVERGVPGLFTYDGYHDVFNARLAEFVSKAQVADSWVMGDRQRKSLSGTVAGAVGKVSGIDPFTREIRRLHLAEYARRWTVFLADIRTLTGNNLAFDLDVLRQFAAPDSPLARLGRAAVRETTLSRPMEMQDKLLSDAAGQAEKKLGIKDGVLKARAESRQEWDLVDSRFAALREVVSGQADPRAGNTSSTSGKPRLDAISGLVNAYYTTLVVANNALNTRNMPPPADAGDQLRMEAAKLPAPFNAVLADLVVQGTRDVNQGVGEILVAKMDAVIGEQCRRAIEGKYPFMPTAAEDVDADDFVRIFASGGVLDDFFQQVLAPHVDTTTSPWRYKLTAPDVPPVAGPSLVPFQHAKEIRNVFFRDPSGKKLAWKVDMKIMEVDPEIVSLQLDIDGQVQRYVHGPVVPMNVTWPGSRGGQRAEITANPRVRPDTSTKVANGPWALMRLIDQAKLSVASGTSQITAEFDFDGRKARFDIGMGGLPNPWTTTLLQGFHCPGRSG
ncbi:type VI secretion system membrane subunit TssM [Cupriavidus pauculus]|uniref:type VI secretion system membrane subunit TssM n=1 Tax=Cupriavidus pauculus TaxID=82633 RepID=UPI0030F7548B